MSADLGVYAFRPGGPDVPASSGTGVFVSSLVNAIKETCGGDDGIDIELRWLESAGHRTPGALAESWAGARWLKRELGRVLRDRARSVLFIYPKIPVLSHVTEPAMLAMAHQAYRLLALKSRLLRRRLLVLVEDLPIEMAEGRARAGGPRPELPVEAIRRIERTLFRAAHRLILPAGFVEAVQAIQPVKEERIRTFHRNIYMPDMPEDVGDEPGFEFEGAKVNFFYSGSIDPSTAPAFREVLKSIRNAPGTRLHVCGGNRDAVSEWFTELEVSNARHYGQLNVADHDRLARRCDVGLILYPTDNPYNHLTPTMKYSAYLANGLAVLATDLRCVAQNISRDGVGQALPIAELCLELLRWTTRPQLWSGFKRRAEALAPIVRSPSEMRGWMEEV